MHPRTWLLFVLGGLTWAFPALAQQPGIARPDTVLEEIVDGLPRDQRQSVRIMTATFRPGERTIPHTHRFPVAVYVLEGIFTLELKGRPPVAVKAGEALVEPANVEMVGYNRSAADPTRVVIFYVATPGTPFLDPTHH
ncbi:MAG: cupin domain-containing protein [Pseudomonadota bacterium]